MKIAILSAILHLAQKMVFFKNNFALAILLLGLTTGFMPMTPRACIHRRPNTAGALKCLGSQGTNYLESLSSVQADDEDKENEQGNNGGSGGGIDFSEGDFSVESTKSAVEFGELVGVGVRWGWLKGGVGKGGR